MTVSAADESAFLSGTWVRWGTGRVPVGVNSSDTNFSTVEKTGGASTHTLTATEMPSHNHSFSGSVTVNANGSHAHQASSGSYKVGSGSGSTYYYMTNGGSTSGQTTGSGGSETTSVTPVPGTKRNRQAQWGQVAITGLEGARSAGNSRLKLQRGQVIFTKRLLGWPIKTDSLFPATLAAAHCAGKCRCKRNV